MLGTENRTAEGGTGKQVTVEAVPDALAAGQRRTGRR